MVDYELFIMERSDPGLRYDFIDDDSEGNGEISIISGAKRKFTHLEPVQTMDFLQSYTTSNNVPYKNRM